MDEKIFGGEKKLKMIRRRQLVGSDDLPIW